MPNLPSNPQVNMDGIRNAVSFVRNANNPYALMQNAIMQNNPSMQKAINCLRQHSGNYIEALRDAAQQNGYDPNAVLSAIKG